MIRILELSDATRFLDRSRGFLMESEAENNLLLSSAWTMAKSSMTRSQQFSFFVAEEDGEICGAALNSSERRLLLSTCSQDTAEALGHELAARDVRVSAVLGPDSSVRALLLAYGKTPRPEGDMKISPGFSQRFAQKLLVLDGPPLALEPASGLLRVAKEKDHKFLLDWSLRFNRECGLDEPAAETEEILRRYIELRRLFVWEDRQPVAMAGFNGITQNGVRVTMVYADPRFRGRGYAGTLVHNLSRRLLADGHHFCCLFTDANNPVANRVYERLGYRAISDFVEYRIG